MNKNEIVLKIGKDKCLTASEVNDFLAFSDSDSAGSDWENMKDDAADKFLFDDNLNNEKQTKPAKRTFTINKPTTQRVFPGEVIHKNIENIPDNKQKGKIPSKYFIAAPTSIRIFNPQVTTDNWKDRTEGRQVLTPGKLCQGNLSESLSDSDWILVGVIVHTSTKKDKNGKTFSIWHLNDLQSLDKHVKVMIFRQVYDEFWKEAAGTVVGILQPKCLPSSQHTSAAFTVDSPLQILVLGRSPDYAICQGKTKSGQSCTNIVNKADCSMCSYHVQSGYFKAISRPGFVNLGLERLNERKRSAAVAIGGGRGDVPIWTNNDNNKRRKGNSAASNNAAGVSLRQLQQSGITARATEWGLLERGSVEEAEEDNSDHVAMEMAPTDASMVKLLKKPTAGTKNIIKHIVEKSANPVAAIATNNNRNARNDSMATAGKAFTFDEFKQKQLERIASQQQQQQAAPPPPADQSIDLGYKPAKLDHVSAEVYRAELNKLRIAAQAKQAGGYAAMKEINRQEHLWKIAIPHKSNAGSLPNVPKKSIINEEMLKLLGQGSSNRKLVQVEKMADFDEKMNKMEVIEKFETKLTGQHEQECVVFICVQCQTKTGRQPKACVADGHTVKRIKGARRYFQCIKCKTRTATYDKYPEGSCLKCGSCTYEKTGRIKERQVASETLLVHGNEKRFINN